MLRFLHGTSGYGLRYVLEKKKFEDIWILTIAVKEKYHIIYFAPDRVYYKAAMLQKVHSQLYRIHGA